MNIDVNISDTCIETERLLMRAWQVADLADLFAYASVQGVLEAAGRPHHKSIADSERLLQSYIDNKNCFALYHLADSKVIGSLELHGSWAADDLRFAKLSTIELGFIISPDYWGRSYAAEAANAAISHCFSVLGADIVTCCHFVENEQSRRVIEKCGFSFMQEDMYFSKHMNKEFLEKQYILFKYEFDTAR